MSNTMRTPRLLFAMSNAVQNTISVFSRDDEGRLTFLGSTPTGGAGTGVMQVDPLTSQGALALGLKGRVLFAVNAGSNTISALCVRDDGTLTLIDQVSSKGVMPNALAVIGGLLYVSNLGNGTTPPKIAGFRISESGRLCPLKGSVRTLPMGALPAALDFTSCGEVLVVSERGTNQLRTFVLNWCGVADDGMQIPSTGTAPFGLASADDDLLLVAEAGPNALSSYAATCQGRLAIISASVGTGQTATCWVSVTPDGRYAYTSNTGSGNVSRFSVAADGRLTLLGSTPTNNNGNASPTDSAIDRMGRNLYVLNGGAGSIAVFSIATDGNLTLLEVYQNTGLPAIGAQGIAVW